MARRVKIALAVLVLVLVGAQAVRVERTNPPVEGEVTVPPEMKALLRRACYDCHSNATVWPWYGNLAPISWLLAHDVKEGRRELNFSVWAAYPAAKRTKKLRKSAKEVADGDMPPWDYVLMHPAARLSAAEREALRAWAAEEIAKLAP